MKTLINKYRMLAAFLANVLVIIILDLCFSYFFDGMVSESLMLISVDYAPEVWFALIALVLGTLVIVISIASQSIIKLIDLYMKDWTSLFYIWFMFLSSAHIIIVYDWKDFRLSSHFLNINVFLLFSTILALPYVFYILRYTKPENIINKIYGNCIQNISDLVGKDEYFNTHRRANIEDHQKLLFDALNQLDDFLTYTQFKEPKSIIIGYFCDILEYYITYKDLLPEKLYLITRTLESDISFRATVSTLRNMETYEEFFEKKCMRIMGNAYRSFIEENLYDLASLSVSEIVGISDAAISINNDEFLDLILIHLNTFFRNSLKHAQKNNEPRNLYNLLYHYRLFLEKLVRGKKSAILVKGFSYLQFYGNEIFKNIAVAPHLYFIIDTIVFEMKMILLEVYKQGYKAYVQKKLLGHFLQVDKPPELIEDAVEVADFAKSKARMIQVSLGLFYMRSDENDYVDLIIHDILEDIEAIGKEKFKIYFEKIFSLLEVFSSEFWEDTDRGNLNIYYTGNREFLEPFKNLLFDRMDKVK